MVHSKDLQARPDRVPRSFARSHVGLVRQVNEDRFLALPEFGCWAVADGMGGHKGGDMAAETVTEFLAGPQGRGFEAAEIEDRLQAAHANIVERARTLGHVGGCGATVAGLIVDQGIATIFWVGDSRVYRFRDDELSLLTRDHRVVQDMLDAGVLDAEQARRHPQASVLTRAIGAVSPLVVDIRRDEVRYGDTYLLATDGLTACLNDDEIAHMLANGRIDDVAADLVALVLQRGAPDNVTILAAAP